MACGWVAWKWDTSGGKELEDLPEGFFAVEGEVEVAECGCATEDGWK